MRSSLKKTLSFCTLVLAVVFSIAGCGNSPQAAQAKIDRIANETKSVLPKMLDRDTKLVNVYTRKLELVSEYELVNFEPDKEEKTAVEMKIKSYLKQQVCPSIKKDLLNSGISSRYIYKSKNGQPVVDLVLSPGDC
jgi:hypothetical protein